MKMKLLIAAISAATLAGCKTFETKPVESVASKQVLSEVKEKGQNGLTRIQRGSEEFGFVLEVDAGDSNTEIVMLDETSDQYLSRIGEVAATDMSKYVEKEKLDEAVNYLLKAQTLAYGNNMVPALELIERALLISPSSTQALAMKGSIMLQLGKVAEAKKSWQEALSYDSTMTDIKAHLESLN